MQLSSLCCYFSARFFNITNKISLYWVVAPPPPRTAYGISPDRNLRDRQVIPLLLLQSFTLQHQQKDKKSWPMGQVSPVVSHCENIFCNLVWNISIRFQFSHFSFPLPNGPANKKIKSQRGSFRWKFWILNSQNWCHK